MVAIVTTLAFTFIVVMSFMGAWVYSQAKEIDKLHDLRIRMDNRIHSLENQLIDAEYSIEEMKFSTAELRKFIVKHTFKN